MGKITVNEIDFDELDDVVADILVEKQTDLEDTGLESGLKAKEIIVEQPIEVPASIEAVEADLEDVVGPLDVSDVFAGNELEKLAIRSPRIMQRARKMLKLSKKERLEHENIRTTRRFGFNVVPTETMTFPKKEPELSAPLPVQEAILPKVKNAQTKKAKKITEVPEMPAISERKQNEIKLQQEILWEITRDLKKKNERPSTRIHKPTARVSAKKPKIRDIIIPAKPKPVTKEESDKIAVKTVSVPVPKVAEKPKVEVAKPIEKPAEKIVEKAEFKPEKIMPKKPEDNSSAKILRPRGDMGMSLPKNDVMKFEGDEYSEEVSEQKTITKVEGTPFIANVKVTKKPLGGGVSKEMTTVSSSSGNNSNSSSLETILSESSAPELDNSRSMRVTRHMKTSNKKRQVASVKKTKKVKEKKQESTRGVDIFLWVLFCLLLLFAGVVIITVLVI